MAQRIKKQLFRILPLSVVGLMVFALVIGMWQGLPQNEVKAALGDGASSNIQLLDSNANGKIDRITFDIANPNLDTWSLTGAAPHGLSVTQSGNDITISAVSITTAPNANPVSIQVDLSEADTDLLVNTDGVTTGIMELIYTQAGLNVTPNIQDGDEELNAIATGDTNATDTEIDSALPIALGGGYLDANGDGTIDGVNIGFSETVSYTYQGTDWTATANGLTGFNVTACLGCTSVNVLSLAATANAWRTGVSGGIEPNLAYAAGNLITDNAANAAANFTITGLNDGAAPVLNKIIPSNQSYWNNLDNEPVNIVSLTFTEKVTATYNDLDWTVSANGLGTLDVTDCATVLNSGYDGCTNVLAVDLYAGTTGTLTGVTQGGVTGAEPIIAFNNVGPGNIVDGNSNQVVIFSTTLYDYAVPNINSATSTTVNGTYGPGSGVDVTLNFSEDITSAAGLTVSLNNTASALIVGGFPSNNTVSGTYTVGATGTGEDIPDLNISGVTGSIQDTNTNTTLNPTIPSGSNLGDLKDITIDMTAATLTTVTIASNNANPSLAKLGDAVTITIVANEPIQQPTVAFTSGGIAVTNATVYGGTGTSWTAAYTVAVGDTDGAVAFTINFNDLAGNAGTQVITTTDATSATVDKTAASGYTVTIDQGTYINASNETTVGFTFAGAEVGTTYNFSFDDTNAGTAAITGSGTIATAIDAITGIDVNTLDDDTITLSVTLTDPAGNIGIAATDTAIKDTIAPILSTLVYGGALSDNTVNQSDVGLGSPLSDMTVELVFNETMDTSAMGVTIVTTPDNLPTAIAFSGFTGNVWSQSAGNPNDTLIYTFNLGLAQDADEDLFANTVSITGTFTDLAGNPFTPWADQPMTPIYVDTAEPIVTAGNVYVTGCSGLGGACISGDSPVLVWSGDTDLETDTITSVVFDGSNFRSVDNALNAPDPGTPVTNDWSVGLSGSMDALETTVNTIDVTVTDNAGNVIGPITSATSFTIDTVVPVLAEVTPVTTPTNNTNPSYTFSSDEIGTITYGGGCNSVTTAAVVGNNTVTLDSDGAGSALADATYNCTIIITDSAGNLSSTLNMTAFKVDTIAPTVSTYSPTDGSTGIAVSANLALTFTENVQAGAGDIVIKKSDNTVVETITIPDLRVTYSGMTATIDPTATLANSTGYYVQIASGAITDMAGNAYAGIADTTTWNFTTVAISGGGGGGGGGGTTTPTSVSTSNSSLTVSPSQSGVLTQGFTDGSQVIVNIPTNSVTNTTTFTVTQSSLTANNTPLASTGAIMIGNQVFDISATSNGVAVTSFNSNLTITITIPSLPDDVTDLGVYYFDSVNNQWVLIPGAVFDPVANKVTFTTNHLTQFAVFKVTGLPSTLAVTTTPVVTPTPTPAPTPTAPTPVGSQLVYDPSNVTTLLAGLSLARNTADESKYRPLIIADAKEFGLTLNTSQVDAIVNFVVYGISNATIKLGSGERRAVIRDYFETVVRPDVVWTDIELISTGQKPIKRNLAKEQAIVGRVLATYKTFVGRAPNFKDAKEDLAWNTLMYRIRFPRDLVQERVGILEFAEKYGRNPWSPLGWSAVRAWGYVLQFKQF